jgi:serine/threonine protein kinase
MSLGVRAVKRVRKKSYAWDEKKEIAAMARVRQFPQHFAYLHGWYESQDWIFLAMDYFEMGDLSHHLQSKIPESQARDITQQLLRGLVEMHGMGITHRDLKPTNIFVVARSDSSWDVRIGDFGISKRVNANETELRTITGTRYYMAPELDPMLVDDEETHTYTQAVDVWALGILLFQMLTLQMAFQDQSSLRKYFKGRTAFPDEPLLRESITSPCIELLMAVLQPKPKDRPASGDTFSYEWMKASSSDSDLAPVQTLLSELRVAPDGRTVGGCIDTRKHKSNGSSIFAGVPKISRWAKTTTSAVGPDLTGVWQQPPGYKRPLQMPSGKHAQGVAAEDPPQTLSAMRPSLLNAVSQQMTDGAPDVSPPYKEQRAHPEDSSLDPEAARRFYWNLGTMTRSAPHIRERPLLRQSQHPTEHRTDLRRYPPYTRDDAGSEKYQPGSLPSVPNVRLTGKLALRDLAKCQRLISR